MRVRSLIVGLVASLAGLTVFLHMPMGSNGNWATTGPAVPAGARAAAAAPRQSIPAPESARPSRTPITHWAAAVAVVPGPYLFQPPSAARLQPLVASDVEVADLMEATLRGMEDFGDGGGAGDMMYLLGSRRLSAGGHAAAADYFEAFASSTECEVACSQRAATLENAVVLRQALGQTEIALRNADAFEQQFAQSDPRAATRVALTAVRLSSGEARIARLQRLRRRRLPPAEAIQAEVSLGKALLDESPRRARAAFRRADRLWERHGGAHMPTSPGLDAVQWLAELSRTREALAEARFAMAERRVRAAQRLDAPSFRGAAQQRRVEQFVERRLRPWLAERLARIRRAERALDSVDELGLSGLSVPVAARRGELYQALADTMGSLDLPEAIVPTDPEAGVAAVVQREGPIHDELVVPAQRLFARCMEAARQTRHYGEWSDRCADGLARHDSRWRRPELGPRRLRVSSPWERPRAVD